MREKKCKQCTLSKPMDMFRQYYHYDSFGSRTDARYKYCKDCEKVNSRYKYLKRNNINPQEQLQIESYYQQQAKKGGIFPGMQKLVPMTDFLAKQAEALQYVPDDDDRIPKEEWLTMSLEDYDPDYLYGDLLERLEEQYVDDKEYLDAVATRFRAYHDRKKGKIT